MRSLVDWGYFLIFLAVICFPDGYQSKTTKQQPADPLSTLISSRKIFQHAYGLDRPKTQQQGRGQPQFAVATPQPNLLNNDQRPPESMLPQADDRNWFGNLRGQHVHAFCYTDQTHQETLYKSHLVEQGPTWYRQLSEFEQVHRCSPRPILAMYGVALDRSPLRLAEQVLQLVPTQLLIVGRLIVIVLSRRTEFSIALTALSSNDRGDHVSTTHYSKFFGNDVDFGGDAYPSRCNKWSFRCCRDQIRLGALWERELPLAPPFVQEFFGAGEALSIDPQA